MKTERDTLITGLTVALRNNASDPFATLDEIACHAYGEETKSYYLNLTDRQVTLIVNTAKRQAKRGY